MKLLPKTHKFNDKVRLFDKTTKIAKSETLLHSFEVLRKMCRHTTKERCNILIIFGTVFCCFACCGTSEYVIQIIMFAPSKNRMLNSFEYIFRFCCKMKIKSAT